MFYLLLATLTASLLGSLHCVGMCGPLAIMASQAGSGVRKRAVAISTVMYHLGRWTTYCMAGAFAGSVGSLINLSGQWLGWQVAAARIAGLLMVGVGLNRLWQLMRRRVSPDGIPSSRIAGFLAQLKPFLSRRSPPARSFGIGFLTTFLPCGWLYLFALAASGTGSAVMGILVMSAFWLGTIPALTSLVAGTGWLSKRTSHLVPIGTALLLIMTGCFTATGRGFAELTSIDSLRVSDEPTDTPTDQVLQSKDAVLPCCRAISLDGEDSSQDPGQSP